jgi:transcriptional regulator with XRE-family HTH domain
MLDSDAMQAEWDEKATELERGLPRVGAYPAAGLLRRARRLGDLSQHDIARGAGVAQSTVARIESGAMTPSLNTLQRLLAVAHLHLVVVDDAGHVVLPMRESEHTRGGNDKRYPSHLDTILDPRIGEWWADGYGLARPPETFRLDRRRRDQMRARSQWEVRVKRFRSAPEPPRPGAYEGRYAAADAWRRLSPVERLARRPLRSDDFDPED